MKKQQLLALGIMAALAVWILIPRAAVSVDNNTQLSNKAVITAVSADSTVTGESNKLTVRAARLSIQEYQENIRVRGRTQAFRTVDVRAEQSGRVVSTPVIRGARVSTGDVICNIAIDTRDVDLQEAESRREQTRFEYDAALDLQKQGLQSAVSVARAKAAYDSSIAQVERTTLALYNTRIRAPFDGVIETRQVEVGDLLNRGSICATIMDDSPMLLVGLVPERDIGKITLGAPVTAKLLTGENVVGVVTYLSRAADAQSRSYRVEVEINKSDADIRAGITAEIFIAASQIQAHLIPASALTLDDKGDVGVKVLDDNGVVDFKHVIIVGDETARLNAGIWVTGLPAQVTLVTHGQEIVFPGQQVERNFDWSNNPR
ncbi:MAG: efflux RND transporter periplasmic adaptor subunit [Gammaproteobacteria bacterium]|nr:efflux RND transporter periplasmic adaptor subunit [Gammaproteobacteria bacterium]